MKNKFLKISLSIVAILIMFGTTNYATADVKIEKEKSEVYEKWQALSKEEKEKYIEPLPTTLNINDSVKMSVFNKFSRGVGGTNTESKYVLDLDKLIIKNQKSTNECWAFATTSMIETNVEKTRNKQIELSPRHIDYATSKTFLDGTNKKGYNREVGFGNFAIALGYCTSGSGPVLETDMPFEDNENKVNLSQIDKKPVLKVENYVRFADILKKYDANGNMTYTNGGTNEYTESQVLGVRNLIKEHIKNYGAVGAFTCLGGEDITKNLNIDKVNNGESQAISYYNNDSNKIYDHAITIIGWDDNYSKENFNDNCKPKNDGAYAVLNSSGGTKNTLSLMMVSYEDVYIEYGNYGIMSTTDIDYNNIYQYDEYGYNVPLPLTNSQTDQKVGSGYIANVFSRNASDKDEYLNEVSIYVATTSNVDIYVNAENDDKTKITKVASAGILEPGYHTVKLATPLKLTGSKFVVAAKLTADEVNIPTETNLLSINGTSTFWDNVTSQAGQSFISLDGENWTDINNNLKDSNVCLKAFTTYQEKEDVAVTGITLDKSKLEMKKGESLNLVATITPSTATNKNVTWTSSNEKVATVSKEGIITAIEEGTTTITVTTEDGNKVAKCEVTVSTKTNNDDDIYYDKNDTNKDTTIATGTIPQTGVKLTIITIIAVMVGTTLFVFIKVRRMKDIK